MGRAPRTAGGSAHLGLGYYFTAVTQPLVGNIGSYTTTESGGFLAAGALGGNEDDDRARMQQTAPGPIDCVLDILPPSVSTTTVRAALMTVRPYGRVALMGVVDGLLHGDGG